MDHAIALIALGLLFLGGLTADQLGRATKLPRVTMLLILGVVFGSSGFNLIPGAVLEWFETISIIALTMVAFLLGGSLTRDNLSRHGREIVVISVAIVVATVVIIFAGLMAMGVAPGLALILGTIATATAPAAMADVIRQSGIKNEFTDTLSGIVAIDDAWGLVVFSLAIIFAGQSDGFFGFTTGVVRDLGGGIMLGAGIGALAAMLTGRLKPGEPLQAEAIGIVCLVAGFSLWLEVSFLISGMTAGAIVANFARHHDFAFHEIENIQWPFMILFFILGGAVLEIDALLAAGWVGALYFALRTLARLLGGYIGARLAGSDPIYAKWYGPALLPQAGVAVGMALVAGDQFPQWASTIAALVISTTVLFEICGPLITLLAIRRVDQFQSLATQSKKRRRQNAHPGTNN